jgi:hypothetical protein
MKITVAISIILLIASNIALADNSQKRYLVESGRIDYEVKGSGNVMGMMTTKTIAKKYLLFNQYGANELKEENKIEKHTQGGKTETIKLHTLSYMKGSVIYNVNFKQKRIMRMKNAGLVMAQMMTGGKNMTEAGEAMMKKMGGKKIGTDKIAGYNCDIWEVMGVKQCLYKGIALKVESNMMGIKSVEIATKAEFDIALSKDDFKLPDFPVYGMNDDMSKPPIKLDKSELDKMDAQAEKQQAKESKDMGDLAKVMVAAAAQAGMTEGKAPSKDRQQAMEQAMQGMMLPMVKKRALAQEEMMRFGKKCLGAADTLEEANQCSQEAAIKFPAIESNSDFSFEKWNPAVKKKVLSDIDQFLQAAPCIKKANSMQQFEKCMPDEG